MLNEPSRFQVAPKCPHCLSSLTRLFIKHNQTSQLKRVGRKQTRKWRSLITAQIIAIVCLALTQWPREISGQSLESKTNLPTVIVRGFLNYRTTVDGTVLLFTPDAGSSSSSSISGLSAQTSQAAPSSTPLLAHQQQQVSAQIEPTSTYLQAASTTFYSAASDEPPAGASSSETRPVSEPDSASGQQDEWRPIQATPPLRPLQTTFRPAPDSETPVAVQSDSPRPQLVAAGGGGGGQAREATQEGRSSPSVQSDDVTVPDSRLLPSAPGRPATGETSSDPSVAPSSASPPTSPHARAVRPKRPSLGFNGQGLRSRIGVRNGDNQTALATGNTINGIRRPGIPNLVTTSSPVVAQSAPSDSGAMGAFQSRLTQAKLRNRFNKRPPFNAANSIQAQATPATNQGLSAPGSTLAALMQPSESGEDLSIGGDSPMAAAARSPAFSPEAPALQTRPVVGNYFSPSSGANISPPGGSPMVGNDEVLSTAAASPSASLGSRSPDGATSADAAVVLGNSSPASSNDFATIEASQEPLQGGDQAQQAQEGAGMKLTSRSGEQRPREQQKQEPQLLSGGLSGAIEGQLGGSMPLSLDGFFQSDQAAPGQPGAEPSELQSSFQSKEQQLSQPQQQNPTSKKNNNDKLNNWLGQHHNKFVPRQPQQQGDPAPGHLSQQLAANLHQLTPSFASNLPNTNSSPKQPATITGQLNEATSKGMKPTVGSLDELEQGTKQTVAGTTAGSNVTAPSGESENKQESLQMQTITKTYSTVMTSFKTRLVPLQVKSSTAIHTITENYVITKMLTAYQTMPVGEFILPEPASTRSPFEIFNETPVANNEASDKEQPIVAPSSSSGGQPVAAPVEQATQAEQPIILDTSPKSPNDWLHDFSNLNNNNNNNLGAQSSTTNQQQSLAAALLEQQAQEANLAGLGLGEPLDQLASSLDPAAEGTINIPDLNNPLVLAAAIQNPQLAAVILAAQQLQLKQRQNKLNNQPANAGGLLGHAGNQAQPVQLQPSYSTSLSTAIKPSTYTMRDTMYTTRLVSFKDGRTVRTRTVSEPGSVIEQVLTTMATEITPVTITIRPTGVLGAALATASPQQGQQLPSSQTTINNALIATQLASLLARRQQQVVQPSLGSFGAAQLGQQPGQLNQLAALQQLIGQQQQRQQAAKFQPNLQQLLQSMQQQQQQPSTSPSSLSPSTSESVLRASNNNASNKPSDNSKVRQQEPQLAPPAVPQATPSLPTHPITTTLTNIQVRTYTVHNAFKTIYRTITSTQLITSTIFPGAMARNTQLPSMG